MKVPACPRCESENTKTFVVSQNKYKKVQRYYCRTCGTTFSEQKWWKHVYPTPVIETAIALYKKGLSLHKVILTLEAKFGLKPSRWTVNKWLRKANVPRRRRYSGYRKVKLRKTVRERK